MSESDSDTTSFYLSPKLFIFTNWLHFWDDIFTKMTILYEKLNDFPVKIYGRLISDTQMIIFMEMFFISFSWIDFTFKIIFSPRWRFYMRINWLSFEFAANVYHQQQLQNLCNKIRQVWMARWLGELHIGILDLTLNRHVE